MTRRTNPWAIVAVALLPVLVLGVLLAALWNPMDRLDTVRAAIVNVDEPVEMDGQPVPLGRQLAAGLVGGAEGSDVNYDWTITDAERAADGLADGTYAAVVTIPEDFSAAATSFGADDPAEARQATLEVATPPGGRVVDDALARIVTTTAASVLGTTLTENYVDGVLVGFSTLADGIGEAADGASELADGASQAATGAGDLADGAGQLADGADELAGGAREAASGAGQLAAGAGALADGASQAASGAGDLAAGAGQFASGSAAAAGGAAELSSGASEAAAGARELAEGAAGVAGGVRGITGGIEESAAGADDLAAGGYVLADGADQVAGGVRELADAAGAIDAAVPGSAELAAGMQQATDEIAAAFARADQVLGCSDDPAAPGCAELAQAAAGLDAASGDVEELAGELIAGRDGLQELASQVGQLADGAEQVADGTRGIADGNAELADGLWVMAEGNAMIATGAEGVADGASGLADGVGALGAGAGDLAHGVGALSAGADDLATGASGLADGVGALGGGASEIATGTSGLASGVGALGDGAGQLADGVGALGDGAGELADGVGMLGDGAGELAGGLDEAAAGIPAYTDAERENLAGVVAEPVSAPGVDGLSTGATGPLFAVVALWLGALGMLTLFPPVAARAFGSTRSVLRLTLEGLALPSAVGAGTGAVVGGILAGVEGLSALGWVGAILLGSLISVCFVAVHAALVGWLGNVGRGVSLLVAVLMIGTGVVATVPAALVAVADFLPTGAAHAALAATVVPEVGGLGWSLTALLVWTLVGFLAALAATARARRTRVAALLA